MTRTIRTEPLPAATTRKFERRLVVIAVAEDETHCAVVCPLYCPPGICSNGIPLRFDDPERGGKRRYFRTDDCKREEERRPLDVDLRVGAERNDAIRGA
jgi:hypothetical protein